MTCNGTESMSVARPITERVISTGTSAISMLDRTVPMRRRLWAGLAIAALLVGGRPGTGASAAAAQDAATPASSPVAAGEADLAGLKSYVVEHVAALKSGADQLLALSQTYYDLAKGVNFDYQAVWDANKATLEPDFTRMRQIFTEDAHGNYEMVEGLVAGLPNLVQYDVWLDAGPTGVENPTNARQWTLMLPDGRTFENPGNLFHTLLEPTLWCTDPAYIGLALDTSDDGKMAIPDGLPDANYCLGLSNVVVQAVNELATAVDAWVPTLSDAFTALVVMLPTADGYFNDWKLSPFVLGEASTQTGFVANSRLLDVLGIYGGLQLTYDKTGPVVAGASPELANQIQTEMDTLVGFVQKLYDNERAGTRYTTEQADQFGSEVQSRAESLAGQITQAAALLDVSIQEV